ncbi:hypothetical protein ACFL4G_12365 [Thermodesulfobacteriota bacterium]
MSTKGFSHNRPQRGAAAGRTLVVFALLSLMTLMLWGRSRPLSLAGHHLVTTIRQALVPWASYYHVWVVTSAIYFLCIPMIAARSLYSLSLREMGIAWFRAKDLKVIALLYVIALPALAILASRDAMFHFYEPYFRGGLRDYLVWTNILMLIEHASFQGVLVALLEPGFFTGRPSMSSPIRGIRAAFAEVRAIDGRILLVILLDGLLFMLIHIGKPLVEVAAALPSGILLASLAYRFRTFLVCYLLHTMTAGTIVALIYLFHPL